MARYRNWPFPVYLSLLVLGYLSLASLYGAGRLLLETSVLHALGQALLGLMGVGGCIGIVMRHRVGRVLSVLCLLCAGGLSAMVFLWAVWTVGAMALSHFAQAGLFAAVCLTLGLWLASSGRAKRHFAGNC